MTAEPARALARAKVNLFLHVTGRRADGYHTLDSLVAFAETGDGLEAEPARGLSLSLDGPFAAGLGSGADNLVLAAATALAAHAPPGTGAALRLTKSLPVAAGLGGGSADAATTLHLLRRLWSISMSDGRLERLGASLGADVPVCVRGRSVRMGGIGHDLTPAPALPETWILLVNPLVAISTAEVFGGLARVDNAPAPALPARWTDAGALATWLHRHTRNDLAPRACVIGPVIAAVLERLEATGALLSRMSGSGATCFGLFATRCEALDAAEAIRRHRPGWWIEVAALA